MSRSRHLLLLAVLYLICGAVPAQGREGGREIVDDDLNEAHTANPTLATTGSGSAYASSCNAVKQSWVADRGKTFVSKSTFNSTWLVTYPETHFTTITYLSSDATPYTLCDGYPRINGSRTVTSALRTTSSLATSLTSTSVFATYPQPECTISPTDCQYLSQSSSIAAAAYSSFISEMSDKAPPPFPYEPICGSATLAPVTSKSGPAACAMQEASVQFLYWPITAASSCNDVCNRRTCPTTTPTPTVSGAPNTLVTWNTTLTSPTVYIAFEGSWAYTSAGRTFNNPQRLLIPQHPESVSSHCGKIGGGYEPPQRVNYADFNSPVPAVPYRCQPRCYTNPLPYGTLTSVTSFTTAYDNTSTTVTFTQQSILEEASANLCTTIYNDYAPILSIPEAFKTLTPRGFVYDNEDPCRFIFNENAVLFDPPLALTQAKTVAQPTMPHGVDAVPTSTDIFATAEPGVYQPTVPQATALPVDMPATQTSAALTFQPTDSSASDDGNVGCAIASGFGIASSCHEHSGLGAEWTLVLPSDGTDLVINGATIYLDFGKATITEAIQLGYATLESSTIAVTRKGTGVIVDGQTLFAGGQVVINGETMSVLPNMQVVEVAGGKTSHFEMTSTNITRTKGVETGLLTVNSTTMAFTELDGVLTIAGQTLTPGVTVIVHGPSSKTRASQTKTHDGTRMENAQTPEATTTSDAASILASHYWLIFGVFSILWMFTS